MDRITIECTGEGGISQFIVEMGWSMVSLNQSGRELGWIVIDFITVFHL